MILQPVFAIFPCSPLPLTNSRPVHSLMLSSHLFLYPSCLLIPFSVPCKMVLARPDERETWLYHCSLRLLTVVRRSSCGPTSCWILARTSSLQKRRPVLNTTARLTAENRRPNANNGRKWTRSDVIFCSTCRYYCPARSYQFVMAVLHHHHIHYCTSLTTRSEYGSVGYIIFLISCTVPSLTMSWLQCWHMPPKTPTL